MLAKHFSEELYAPIFDNIPNSVIIFSLDGNIIETSQHARRVFGYSQMEIKGMHYHKIIVSEQLEEFGHYFLTTLQGNSEEYEIVALNKNREVISLNVKNSPLIIKGEVVGVFSVLEEITKSEKKNEYKDEWDLKLRSLAESSLVGIYIRLDEKIIFVNGTLTDILGYEQNEMLGSNVLNYIHPEELLLVGNNLSKPRNTLGDTRKWRVLKKDQSVVYIEVHESPTIYQGQLGFLGTVIDITNYKQAENVIKYMDYHDGLTGLPNRKFFQNMLDLVLSKSESDCLSLLFIDLDQFKLINDAMGHEIGDRLFMDISKRLKKCVSNQGEIGRNRGDEFLVFLPEMDKEDAITVAQNILNYLSEPFNIDKYDLHVTPSIGVSLYPSDAVKSEDLIKKAEMAMYQVKKGGKNGYQLYKQSLHYHSSNLLELEMDLWKALERNEFQLYYQPKYDLVTGKLSGVEALIRWIHPAKGLVSPGEFIPLAEKTGLIVSIGEWVLRTACSQIKAWQVVGMHSLEVSVNLSVRQLYQPNLADLVLRILNETGLEAKYLELEVTETMMMESTQTVKVLKELKKLGIKISLDDFGTGFSSLHYLQKAPINKLKIDQSFVRQCTDDANNAVIVKTIIAMAHQLELEVIAEGVETKDHLLFLQHNLCDGAQGYLFSKPLPADEFVRQLNELNKIVESYSNAQGIKHKKWFEKALNMARQELKETLRLQQGMIFKFTEDDGKFIHTLCDGELLHRMGLVQEQIIGKELYDFLPVQNAIEKNKYYRSAWEGQMDVSYEGYVNDVYYLASLRPVFKGGKVVEVIGSCIDITERKRIEKNLSKSQSINKLITENITDLVLILDTNGVIEYASPSHAQWLGMTPDSLENKKILEIIQPDDIQLYDKNLIQMKFNEIILSGKPFQVEFRYQHKNGNWLDFEAKWTPILGNNQEIQNVVVVARDITERKAVERKMVKDVRLTTAGKIAGDIAHEIKNPLSTIKGFLKLMKKGYDEPYYSEVMLSEVNQIEEVIDELLTLVKDKNK